MNGRLVHIVLAAAIAALAAASCGRGKGNPAPGGNLPARAFPTTAVPGMISDPLERQGFTALHFWDAFTDTTAGPFRCDSLTVEGVRTDDLEQAMSNFSLYVVSVPPETAKNAARNFINRVSAFQKARPGSNMFAVLTDLSRKYLYDPNSPLRREDAYGVIAGTMKDSPLVAPGMRPTFAYEERICSMNAEGTVAADFAFTDISGRNRTLHGIKADLLILIFGDPDCQACKEIVESMRNDGDVNGLVAAGKVKVADIYIDREVAEWRSKASAYPKEWINGYDHNFLLRENRLYGIRAIPSIYVLDSGKTVLMKDATTDRLLKFIASYARNNNR